MLHLRLAKIDQTHVVARCWTTCLVAVRLSALLIIRFVHLYIVSFSGGRKPTQKEQHYTAIKETLRSRKEFRFPRFENWRIKGKPKQPHMSRLIAKANRWPTQILAMKQHWINDKVSIRLHVVIGFSQRLAKSLSMNSLYEPCQVLEQLTITHNSGFWSCRVPINNETHNSKTKTKTLLNIAGKTFGAGSALSSICRSAFTSLNILLAFDLPLCKRSSFDKLILSLFSCVGLMEYSLICLKFKRDPKGSQIDMICIINPGLSESRTSWNLGLNYRVYGMQRFQGSINSGLLNFQPTIIAKDWYLKASKLSNQGVLPLEGAWFAWSLCVIPWHRSIHCHGMPSALQAHVLIQEMLCWAVYLRILSLALPRGSG